MHSEHLTNLHPGWVVGGWLIAVAVTFAVAAGTDGLVFQPKLVGSRVGLPPVVVLMAVLLCRCRGLIRDSTGAGWTKKN